MDIRNPLPISNEIDVRGEICKIISRMLDNPNEYGIYPTTRCYDELEAFVKSYAEVVKGISSALSSLNSSGNLGQPDKPEVTPSKPDHA